MFWPNSSARKISCECLYYFFGNTISNVKKKSYLLQHMIFFSHQNWAKTFSDKHFKFLCVININKDFGLTTHKSSITQKLLFISKLYNMLQYKTLYFIDQLWTQLQLNCKIYLYGQLLHQLEIILAFFFLYESVHFSIGFLLSFIKCKTLFEPCLEVVCFLISLVLLKVILNSLH